MIALIMMTDGRADYLHEVMASIDQLQGPITTRIIHDDSGDPAFRGELEERYGQEWGIAGAPGRSGFAGAYHHAWAHMRSHVVEPLIFSTEDDFVFERPVDLAAMQFVLARQDHLTQLALRRQPWGPNETEDGPLSHNPDGYVDVTWEGHDWIEHQNWWTTNPSLYRRQLIVDRDWPAVPPSEQIFSHELYRDHPDLRSAYWGRRDEGPWVTHIGVHRHPQSTGHVP